jgi:hypothetical protein
MNRKTVSFDRPALLAGILLAGLAMLGGPPHAFSQSCALCYTQAASAGQRMIEALRSGILILIVPPTFLSVCMVFILRHKRNQFRQAKETISPDSKW